MSAFCGILYTDGSPAPMEELGAMSFAFARSGPDGQGAWHRDGVGLAHRMLFTTVESLRETLPFENPATRNAITGDIRLDNREDLLRLLDWPGPLSEMPSDSRILLGAYEKWGESCLDHLVGDFAFAIWDARRGELFLGRDHFGVKPLYYARFAFGFIFGSEIKSLLAHPGMEKELNVEHLRSVLERAAPDAETTFYRQVLRLPAASCLRLGSFGSVKRCYWKLDPEAELPPQSDEQFAAEFRRLFYEAVRCRLRSAGPVGCHLSGGLDSSSIACAARDLRAAEGKSGPLKTYSNVFRDVQSCDEREFIEEVLATGGMERNYIEADATGPLAGIHDYFAMEEEGFFSPNASLVDGPAAAMQRAGVRVCLDGFDGDTTVSHGMNRFGEMAKAGQWREFQSEARALAQLQPSIQPGWLFSHFGLPVLGSLARRHQWREFIRSSANARRHCSFNYGSLVLEHLIKPACPEPLRKTLRRLKARFSKPAAPALPEEPRHFSPHFERLFGQVSPGNYVRNRPAQVTSVREEQIKTLSSGLITFSLELISRTYARHGIEARHPFLDKRLVEFCVALPAAQKRRAGFGRAILRQAFRGILPEKVRVRTSKANFSPSFVLGALQHDRHAMEQPLQDESHPWRGLLNVEVMKRNLELIRKSPSTQTDRFVRWWVAYTTAYWLHRSGFAPTLVKNLALPLQ